jgi:hypothetical protein
VQQCVVALQNFPARQESIGRLRIPRVRWEIQDQLYPFFIHVIFGDTVRTFISDSNINILLTGTCFEKAAIY